MYHNYDMILILFIQRYPGGWQKLPKRNRGEEMQKETEEKEKQEEHEKRRQKTKVWKRKKIETEEWKES